MDVNRRQVFTTTRNDLNVGGKSNITLIYISKFNRNECMLVTVIQVETGRVFGFGLTVHFSICTRYTITVLIGQNA